jgi:hypothetical protein
VKARSKAVEENILNARISQQQNDLEAQTQIDTPGKLTEGGFVSFYNLATHLVERCSLSSSPDSPD